MLARSSKVKPEEMNQCMQAPWNEQTYYSIYFIIAYYILNIYECKEIVPHFGEMHFFALLQKMRRLVALSVLKQVRTNRRLRSHVLELFSALCHHRYRTVDVT